MQDPPSPGLGTLINRDAVVVEEALDSTFHTVRFAEHTELFSHHTEGAGAGLDDAETGGSQVEGLPLLEREVASYLLQPLVYCSILGVHGEAPVRFLGRNHSNL